MSERESETERKRESSLIFILPVGMLALPVTAFKLFEKPVLEKTVNTYSAQSLSPIGSERTNLVVLTVTSSCKTFPLFIMVMS